MLLQPMLVVARLDMSRHPTSRWREVISSAPQVGERSGPASRGANEDTISWGVERYRLQLLEQLLKMVIRNGPEWFGGREWRAMLDAVPSSGVSH